MAEDKTLTIPWPTSAPLGIDVTAEGVKAVWDTYVVPTQSDDAPPQSIETRTLMAILRAVYEGMRVNAPALAIEEALRRVSEHFTEYPADGPITPDLMDDRARQMKAGEWQG